MIYFFIEQKPIYKRFYTYICLPLHQQQSAHMKKMQIVSPNAILPQFTSISFGPML
ncbi:hypothetical protein HMPREF1870_02515 [Bacteroidales bacterium KA00344]|nr:hypothetical protein HMPREF1870_02515 [Bacteroidales bacterium KA00344]